MFNVTKKSIQWGNETLTLESGKVARQADGSVIATYGETSVMANVTYARAPKAGQDFFPPVSYTHLDVYKRQLGVDMAHFWEEGVWLRD